MKPVFAINRLLNRLQDRFRRSRSGSVLILVVALLVLMALLGTAFISTARTDRYSAVVNSANTQIDLLVQGIINMAVGNVVDDLYHPTPGGPFGAKEYRKPPLDGVTVVGGYEHHDAPETDLFVASRLPALLKPFDTGDPVTDPAGDNPPTWRGVTWPLTPRADGTYWFDRPGASSISLAGGKGNLAFSPTFATTTGGQVPALRVWQRNVASGAWTSAATDILRAADADGDGFADAGLWKIPLGAIDGITYYAAARIIDNNSAINVNTALSRNMDFNAAGGGVNSGLFFPSRVGLAEMLNTYNPAGTTLGTLSTEMGEMNFFRFNKTPPVLASPIADDGSAPSPDFDFMTLGDALNSQIARRIKAPGVNTVVGTTLVPYQTYGIGESMTLAYRGGLRNPNVGMSSLEEHLQESLIDGVPAPGSYPQTRAAVLLWYNDLYNYDTETVSPSPPQNTFKPLRSLLVASNPVANQAPAHFADADVNPNDTPDLRNDLPPGLAGMAPYVTAAGQQANPPRVSINTAQFGDLYRAFWNVMVDAEELEDPPGSGIFRKAAPVEETLQLFDSIPGNRDARMDPYYGQRFDPLPPYASIPTEQNPARMFRSPIRDTRVPAGGGGGAGSVVRMLPYDVLKLRAAIAAVNAMDLRDSDDDVSEEIITVNVIEDNTNDAAVETTDVRVFGTEMQPYITEVYANLHNGPTTSGINPNGYVAIELSNPYPFPIPLRAAGSTGGWSVGLIDRNTAPAKTELSIVPLDPAAADPVWDFPEGTFVPAATATGPGKLVLENYAPPGDPFAGDPGAATYRPQLVQDGGLTDTSTIETVYVAGLHRVFANAVDPAQTGGEFVLLRPRSGSGVAVDNSGSGGPNEIANLYDLIPVDSFDFSGMSYDSSSMLSPYLWMHYVRENGPGYEWRFVYPGRYDASANEGTTNINARHQGVQMLMYDPASPPDPPEDDILPEKPVALGTVDPIAPAATHYTNPFTIQLANTDFGGHNKMTAAPYTFPFGAFARNGDIVQVPFIGAYVIDSPDSPLPNVFIEMNSVPMDSVFAEDTDTSNDPVITGTVDTGIEFREQIGRFYPIMRNTNTGTVLAGETDDYDEREGEYWNFGTAVRPNTTDDPTMEDLTAAPPIVYVPQWRYRWSMDLFDHITVQAPHDDYFPDMNKSVHTTVDPVSNSGGPAGDSTVAALKDVEHREPIEGLININSASWKVLSALPLVISDGATTSTTSGSAPPAGEVFPALTRELARLIVYYRDVDADPFTAGNQPHGPFKTIMELNKVVDTRPPALGGPSPATMELNLRPGFRNAMGTIHFAPGAAEPNDNQGDFSPATAATDGVRADFEEKSLALSRISNLITTRSDSYTCYILVQGYRDAESANPELIVERRVAFLLDRSRTVPAFPQPVVTKIPNN